MSVLIVGSEGAQGKRYQAILKHLEVPFFRHDLTIRDLHENEIRPKVSRILICSSTESHIAHIDYYSQFHKPILVEKPISKHIDVLRRKIEDWKKLPLPISMVHQYRWCVSRGNSGDSSYNYFRHGNDGLVWDCLQIIALAKDKIYLAENSPVWTCRINGEELDLREMDSAYAIEIQNWLNNDEQVSLDHILDIHEKVSEYERSHKTN